MTWCDTQCLEGAGGVGAASSLFTGALQLLAASQCLLTEPWPPQASLHNGSVVDVIIVGGGTGGSALAARLAETNLTVLLLEAGPDPPMESIVPGFQQNLLRTEYDWNYSTVDDHHSSQELSGHRTRLRLGRMLGGTGSLNQNIYSRGFPDDYDRWADTIGDATWNWNNVLPFFKKSEKLTEKRLLDLPASHEYHGTDGEIEVTALDPFRPDTEKFMSAFNELGYKRVVDRHNSNELGYFHVSYTIKDGKRQSSLTAMLNKVAERENLYVMKNAFVTKILIKEGIAYGVKVMVDDEEWEFYANKEVVVSAGTYNTPKVLMLSGIGIKEHLRVHGIDVVKDLPVGNNLQDHFALVVYLAAEKGTCDYNMDTFEVIKYLYNRTGLLSVQNRVGFDYPLNDSKTPNLPDYSLFPTCVPVNSNYYEACIRGLDYTEETCRYLDSINKKYELIGVCVEIRKMQSRGSVRLASADPFDKPIIRSNVFTNEEDLESIPEVMGVVWSLTNTSYFKSKNAFMVDLKLKSCEGLEWPESVKCVAKSVVHAETHGTSTAPMGAVVDGRLRVRGVRRLRVVDASVMATIPHGNTNAAVIMIAEKAADFIKQEYGLTEHYHM